MQIYKKKFVKDFLILLFPIIIYFVPILVSGTQGLEDYVHTHFSLKIFFENNFLPIISYYDLIGPGSKLPLGIGLDFFYFPAFFIKNLKLFYFLSLVFCFYIQLNFIKKITKLINCKYVFILFFFYVFNITFLHEILISDSIKTLFSMSLFPVIFYYFLKFIDLKSADYFFKLLLAFSYFFLNSHPTIIIMILISLVFLICLNKTYFFFSKRYFYFGIILFLILISEYVFRISNEYLNFIDASTIRQQTLELEIKHFSSGIVFILKFFEDFFNLNFPYLTQSDPIDYKLLPFGGLLFYFAFFWSIKKIFNGDSKKIYYINYLFLLTVLITLIDLSKITFSIINNNHTYRSMINFLSILIFGNFLTKIENKKILHFILFSTLMSLTLHVLSTIYMKQNNQKNLTFNPLYVNKEYKKSDFFKLSKNFVLETNNYSKTYLSDKVWITIKKGEKKNKNYQLKKLFLSGNIFHFNDLLDYKFFPFNGEFKNSSKHQLRKPVYTMYAEIDSNIDEINDEIFFNLFNIKYLLIMKSELNDININRFTKLGSIETENDQLMLFELKSNDKIILKNKILDKTNCQKNPNINCIMNSNLLFKKTKNIELARIGLNKYKIVNNSSERQKYVLPFLYDTGWKVENGKIEIIENSLMYLDLDPNSINYIFYNDDLRITFRILSIICFLFLISIVINNLKKKRSYKIHN